jgi:hypothetical protein
MNPDKLLIIDAAQTRQRMTGLLERMEGDAGLRQLFVSDPAGVIGQFVLPDAQVPAAEVNRGNRLLYSLLSNERFLAWAREYERDLLAQAKETLQAADPWQAMGAYLAVADRGRLHADLAAAVAEFADKELIASLMWQPRELSASEPGVAVAAATWIFLIAVVALAAVAVAAVFAGPPIAVALEDGLVDRAELRAVANQVAAQLGTRAAEVRQSGALTDFARRDTGRAG